jgi:hypothetical protein
MLIRHAFPQTLWRGTYAYGAAGLRGPRLVESLCSCIAPFCGLFALFFVLLESSDVSVAQE